MFLSPLLLLSGTTSVPLSGSNSVTLTNWCDNSMRVRIAPTDMPAETAPAAKALAETLAAKNMTDLDAALIKQCNPGTPVSATRGLSTTNGNLVATVGADDSVSFTRKDTGETLFSAKATFSLNKNFVTAGDWTSVPNKAAPTCSSSEYMGDIGKDFHDVNQNV